MTRPKTHVSLDANPILEQWIIGPLGERLTASDLPAAGPQRWHPRRKAEIVAAVTGGLLTVDAACDRYNLTIEEYASWQRGIERDGLRGLRTTCVQKYRDPHGREPGFSNQRQSIVKG
jgi:hypothetical protein